MRTFIIFAALVLTLFYSIHLAAAETVYVNIDLAQIRDNRQVSSQVVTQVKRGDALRVLNHQGRWYYVLTAQQAKGWIYQYKVTSDPPEDTGDVFVLLSRSTGGMDINEASSASGIRGLNPVSERHAHRHGYRQGDIEAVRQMERFRVNAKQYQRFLQSGKLGEYQGENR